MVGRHFYSKKKNNRYTYGSWDQICRNFLDKTVVSMIELYEGVEGVSQEGVYYIVARFVCFECYRALDNNKKLHMGGGGASKQYAHAGRFLLPVAPRQYVPECARPPFPSRCVVGLKTSFPAVLLLYDEDGIDCMLYKCPPSLAWRRGVTAWYCRYCRLSYSTSTRRRHF